MRAYFAVLTLRFREGTQYRAAAWAGVFTQVVFGFIIFMSLDAFRLSNPARSPMTRGELLAYTWMGQAFFALLPWNVDRDVAAMVRSGNVVYELCRPIDAYALWYFRALGWRTSAAALRCAPLLAIVTLGFHLIGLDDYVLPAPPNLETALAFALAMPVSVLLGIAITMLLQVTVLWTHNVEGVQRMGPAVVLILSGAIVPLPMFPDSVRPWLEALPFRGVVDVPYRTYSGSLPPGESVLCTLQSCAWCIALIWIGRRIMRRGFRRLLVFGG